MAVKFKKHGFEHAKAVGVPRTRIVMTARCTVWAWDCCCLWRPVHLAGWQYGRLVHRGSVLTAPILQENEMVSTQARCALPACYTPLCLAAAGRFWAALYCCRIGSNAKLAPELLPLQA